MVVNAHKDSLSSIFFPLFWNEFMQKIVFRLLNVSFLCFCDDFAFFSISPRVREFRFALPTLKSDISQRYPRYLKILSFWIY